MADSNSLLLPPRAPYTTKTPIGPVRNVTRFTWVEMVYVFLVIVSVLGVVSMSIKSLVAISEAPGINATSCVAFTCVNDSTHVLQRECPKSCDSWICKEDFIFAVLLLVNLAFCACYAFDGLFRERGFETLAYVLGVMAVLLYVIVNYARNVGTGSTHIFKLIRLISVCVFAPPNILLAIVVWRRMGKLNFLMVGCNSNLMKAYHIRSGFVTLLIFNVELMASVTTLAFVRNSMFLSIPEMVVLPVVLCLTILLAVFTIVTVSCEWQKAMFFYYPFSAITTLYYISKVVTVAREFNDYVSTPDHCSTPEGNYQAVAAVLIFACGLGTLAYVFLIPAACFTHRNFGNGLKNIGTKKTDPPNSLNNRIELSKDLGNA